jgi:hypothetical protein
LKLPIFDRRLSSSEFSKSDLLSLFSSLTTIPSTPSIGQHRLLLLLVTKQHTQNHPNEIKHQKPFNFGRHNMTHLKRMHLVS